MGRQYTVEHYLERLARIRQAVPDIAISTDVIVGFCGETEAQFQNTLSLLETVGYEQVFSAAYSERPGTPATRLPDDVPPADKRRRLNELLRFQDRIGLERNRTWLGRDVEVLVEREVAPRGHDHDDDPVGEGSAASAAFADLPAGQVHLVGRTRQSKLVHLAGEPSLVGRFVTARIQHAGGYALRGIAV
jgi:tRNA-2-methylthio-N6-dimethylallyladenosine synthase